MRRVNYLNNRDILKEIHKSKIAYCSFTNPGYSEYDIIIRDLAEIPKLLKGENSVAKTARADRLTKLAQDAASVDGKKVKVESVAIDPCTIQDHEVIFRFMSWGHIPEAPPPPPKVPKNKKTKELVVDEPVEYLETEYDVPVINITIPTKYMKVNFQPFQHFKLDEQGNLCCVGKSHWLGDIEHGHFSKDHGKITNTLAMMYMKLCDRYATRSNWRGYTYVDEMKSTALLQLSQIGLQFDESVSSNPFAYYTMALQNSFTRVLNLEKRNQNIRDDILEMNNLTPSFSRQNSDSHGSDGGYYEE